MSDVQVTEESEFELQPDDAVQQAADALVRLQELRRVLARDPRNLELLNQLGLAAEEVGDLDRARWAYKRAIRLDPQNALAYRNLGLLDQKEGRTRQAVESLEKSLSHAGRDLDTEPIVAVLRNLLAEDADEISRLSEESPAYRELAGVLKELGLSPAEAMMLLDPDSSNGRLMMGYTLLDLIARGVLELNENYEVGRGKQFGKSRLKPHEALFAKYFSRLSNYVDLELLAQSASSELKGRDELFKGEYVRQGLVEKGYMQVETERVLRLFPVPRYRLSDKGIRTRRKLGRLLKDADRQVGRMIQADPQRSKGYIEEGGPAILLLDELPASYFQEWQEILTRIGLGPSVEYLRKRAQQPTGGSLIDDILKRLFGDQGGV